MSTSFGPIPRGFVRRTTTSVLLIFLVTMVVFLWAGYSLEESLHYKETFEHLEETSAVLSLLPALRKTPTPAELAALEDRLAERTSVPHRVIITESNFDIVASSDGSLVGEDVRTRLDLVSYRSSSSDRATAQDSSGRWLASSGPLDAGDKRLFLLRSRIGSEGFVSRFWGVHGLHVGVTTLLFFLLLRFLGERYVRRPIEQLAAHIQRVEEGEFQTRPERYEHDEFGWLAERFTRMGLRLRVTVERLVRSEKLAAASAVAYQVAREAIEPLTSLKRHITYVEGLAGNDNELKKVAASLEKDRHQLVLAVVRLEKLGAGPQDPGAEPRSGANSFDDSGAGSG